MSESEQERVERLPSKIVQLQSASLSGDNPHAQLFALCEDGSLWVKYLNHGYRGEWWYPIHASATPSIIQAACSLIGEDSDLAWTWHCNIACCVMDEGIPHAVANEAAARFMKLAFDVDVKLLDQWTMGVSGESEPS